MLSQNGLNFRRVGPLNLTARMLQDEPTGFHDNRAERWSVHKSVVQIVSDDEKGQQIYFFNL